MTNPRFYAAFLVCFMLLMPGVVWAQTGTITGTVTDSLDGVPLPGVNVVIAGTTQGAATDTEGRFTISGLEPGVYDLRASFVSYAEKIVADVDVREGETTEVNIALAPAQIGLDEVVVVGYGTQRREDVTGAISSVRASDFNAGVSLSPEQLMQGKVAGVNITQSSGRPGASSTVRIRGSSSISAGNDPLYVIDGVPLQLASANSYVSVAGESTTSPFNSMSSNPLNTLNPADIESIDILKDASATAIYGSRGANGVVIITTKNSSASTVNYDSYVSVSQVRNTLPFLSYDDYVGYAEDNGLAYPNLGAQTMWQDHIFRTAVSHNHNVSFGGAYGSTNYRASLGYTNQDGVIVSSNLEKYTGRINLTHRAIDEKLRVDLNLTAARVDEDNAPVSSNVNNEGGNMLKDALRWAPTLPVRNEDGTFYQIGELRVNPVSWQQLDDITERNTVLGDVTLAYSILESLDLSVNLGHTDEFINRFNHVPSFHPVGANEGGRAAISKLQNESSLIETNLNYSDQLSENSFLSFLAGYSFQRFVVQTTFTSANQFASDATKWNLIQSGNTLVNTSNKSANRLSSVYGRVNYRLMDRYMFTFTLRNDGSSRFGENNRWGLFPSGAVAWNISDEPFFSPTAVNNLKLRLGYGVTGNQEIPNNLFREQLSIAGSATYSLGGQAVPSVLPSNYPNPDLKWERTSQLNVGLDVGLFDSRLSGSVDYYLKNTTDLLLQFSTAAPSVVETQWANVGEVENRGLEVVLDADLIRGEEFFWSSSLNFSRNRNEVISLSNDQFSRDNFRTGDLSGVVSSTSGQTQIIKPGLPLGTFWGRKFTGLDENGMETYLDEDGEPGADLVAIGDPNPDFTYGISSTVRWKNFDSSISLRGVVGNDVFNNTAAEFSYTNILPGSNVLESALSSSQSRDQTAQFSSRWIEDGSYLRLAYLTVGYSPNVNAIPQLSRARIYVTGQNLLLLTGYSGFDPEVRTNTNRGGTAPIGIDYLAYPRPRTLQLGVSLSF